MQLEWVTRDTLNKPMTTPTQQARSVRKIPLNYRQKIRILPKKREEEKEKLKVYGLGLKEPDYLHKQRSS